MGSPLIVADDVRVGYGAREVLRGVSATVEAGELLAIVGPNGAGKTTLLRAMAGLLAPATGQVSVFLGEDASPTKSSMTRGGVDPFRTPRREIARRLAYLPQKYELAFPFTVGEIVLMGRYARRRGFGLERAEDLAAARDAMDRCDVTALEDRRFDQISGGEQRRALLAQALCQAAEVLLLDEPTAALDPAHARALFTTLSAERSRGAAAVVVTHDLNAAVRWADRMIILADGHVIAEGAPADVLASEAAARAFAIDIHVGALPSGAKFAVPS